MPKTSCIEHAPNQNMVVIRADYSQLFDGDHCTAAVMALIEFLTNGEISRREMAEEPGDPWIKASMNQIIERMLNFYSVRSVQQSIDLLLRQGIIQEHQKRLGTVKSYLLQINRVNTLLKKKCVIRENLEEISSAKLPMTHRQKELKDLPESSAATSAATSAILPMTEAENPQPNSNKTNGLGCLASDVLRSSKYLSNKNSSLSSNEVTTTDAAHSGNSLTSDELAKLLCSWFKQLRGIVSFPKVLRELVHSNVQRLDEDLLGLLPTAWDAWKQETYWADFQADHKVRAFFAYLKGFDDASRNGCSGATEGASIVARAQSRVQAPPSPNGGSNGRGADGHSTDNGSVVVQMWNAAMPERATSLKSAFIGPDPQKIIERCSYIISNHPDKDWLTLEWICQTKDGKPGWQKIMEPKYDWMTKPQKLAYPGARPSYLDAIERRVAARHAAEAAAAAQAAAEEGGTESDEDK